MAPEARYSWIVGNDVVDLGAPRATGMSRNRRFLERVFTGGERERIGRGADPDLELWLGWAAKEAGYKVVSKLRGEAPVFVHRAFEVCWDADVGGEHGGPVRRGTVRHEHLVLPVHADVPAGGGYVHTLAWAAGMSGGHEAADGHPLDVPPRTTHTVERIDRSDAPWLGGLDALESRLTERERDAVHSVLSAAVRIGARAEAARLLNVAVGRLEIVCRPGRIGRRPPTVLVDGAPANIDVSLSHDGPWIAWAFAPVDEAVPTPDHRTTAP